ncbi:phosphogluconate dehydrogenase (NADP(+)-dependent, decarboxylating) [Candidatus Methylacidiphilum fumarolicum]|uniref:6-phosphogluconate dehydrogenase, decarboxylating n=2 Tax=Candidatus Methylacidiphilum fumarolicum TaxID=591154 RepID=I0JVP6_METFB|nr:NADP-dependent phosphogluconate dehydrogenase [Candidatus Methylacidiphilum fumarolicum]AEH40991.1 6-phosphogluconate dehydrogenase [Methylacidiphilum fumariolicum SolV]MBW6414066.1 NADP-dependent phosphogluconate dehydrogenase [Candidatus Methylacidiphilum fumarolicum]TFE66416.1 phosphogluconate dehydrogenase (NADP(+)-dependent, decarboxylating) [Candidatus Methylacidiphilum fumarolicum]TFE75247.1 phosphogluconate dehydrogenase (NADP(+)-dependent, decarboxylating) [Candidatus Methylacidiphi
MGKSFIGIIGLGVMGRNLALNILDHGFTVSGLDKDLSKVVALKEESKEMASSFDSVENFIHSLEKPKKILFFVPAGHVVDQVIEELLPFLESGDILIDGGNSFFRDTERRQKELKNRNIFFIGMGTSGGESGARHGPSLMIGGDKEAYEHLRSLLEAISAKVEGEPCVDYMGRGAAGHYVKMVHNGIEYGIMELIGECYDFAHRVLKLDEKKISDLFEQWSKEELASYLMEITVHILRKRDDKSNDLLLNKVLDVARQLGTGAWTSEEAFSLQVPAPIIDAAVTMRNLSSRVEERKAYAQHFKSGLVSDISEETFSSPFYEELKKALFLSIICTYAQGFSLLSEASKRYDYSIDLEKVAKVWRGGCIIRSQFLEKIRGAFQANPQLSNLLLDPNIFREIEEKNLLGSLRNFCLYAIKVGLPAYAFLSALSYIDAFRSEKLPANLIQLQRDYFGSHTYERIDLEGTFHTIWE